MYVPRFNALDDAEELRTLVETVGSAQLVTVGVDGYPLSTLLPVIWDDDRLVFHMARANQHWKAIVDGTPALAVVTGPEAYVSPSWYASKASTAGWCRPGTTRRCSSPAGRRCTRTASGCGRR